MSDELGTYSFLPWLRQGIANNIAGADFDAGVKLRASVHVELGLTGKAVVAGGADLVETVPRDVALYGPGDIIGIDSKAVVKTEPHNWITNFETNYLPYIDFYDEDFPWRYTPAQADTAKHRLRPWICLVTLKEQEFKDGQNMKDRPLPYIEVATAAACFPKPEQLWAWAHVHINKDVVQRANDMTSTDMNTVLPAFQAVLNQNPDLAYSRILSPRMLDENSAYHAFLVPVFETGRLAGLGHDPAKAEAAVYATFSAWGDYPNRPEPQFFPYYFRWYFRTGSVGDFEYLVRLLKPQPMPAQVGRRDMDVQRPAVQIRGITDVDLGGILKLGGALRVPFDTLAPPDKAEVLKYENWAEPYPHDFQRDLASFINLADDYSTNPAFDANQAAGLTADFISDPDPLITSPLYGRWHALTQRLEMGSVQTATSRNWVHELNLDPRWRVAAGFGTNVVQTKQEEYMDAAWDQIGAVLESNRRIRLARFARLVSTVWHGAQLTPMFATVQAKALALTAPMTKRIVLQGVTLFHKMNASPVPAAATSAPMRRVMRSRSRLMQKLPFTATQKPEGLLSRLNQKEVSAAPPKVVPETLPTLSGLRRDLQSKLPPPSVPGTLQKPWFYLLLAILLLGLLFILPFNPLLLVFVLVAVAALVVLALRAGKSQPVSSPAQQVQETNQTPASVDGLPTSQDFTVTGKVSLAAPPANVSAQTGGADSAEAANFKVALKESYDFVQRSGKAGEAPARTALNLGLVAQTTLAAIDPKITLPRLVLSQIMLPARIVAEIGETFTEAMAYPVLDMPMYKPLVDISSELFLPNINFVPQNSISLLETNQKFIESYMIGLNHEFARELLWREYPTDHRGSYFRQFWDVSSFFNRDNLDDESLREKLRDIPPLDHWSRYSDLGEHNNRETGGASQAELVLVIRGELLKKYPNAVIYAHRAKWQLKANGDIDNQKERVLDEDDPITDRIKTPLYEAKVLPDINFFGFDLTAIEAVGGTGEKQTDDPGWFFVIKERPGEPRFGLDINRDGDIHVWNDLSWNDALPGAAAGQFLQISDATATIALTDPHGNPDLQEEFEQYDEDKSIVWDKNANAASLAYVLYQVPVLVAVHASEMLPKQ